MDSLVAQYESSPDKLAIRDKLIEHKIGHAIRIAWFMRRKWGNGDFIDLAFFRLVKCITLYLERKDWPNGRPPLDAFFTRYMYYRLKADIFEEKQLICVSESTKYRHIKKGTFELLNVAVESNIHKDGMEILETLVLRLNPNTVEKLTVNMDSDYDIKEIVESVLKNDEERRILELRILGCSDKEIATEIKRSPSYVQKQRTNIMHAIKVKLNT